jgi:hyperosmotically inducible periplasmic protein
VSKKLPICNPFLEWPRKLALLLAFFLLLPVAITAKKDKDHNDAFMPGQANEARLQKEVRHQLLQLPYYGVFDDLAFKADGSTITLMGVVTQPTLKKDAESAIKRVEGVTNVVNQIEVLPLSPNDDQIRLAEYRAIYGDSALSARYGFRALPSIHILVKNGNVQLEGWVANKFDYDLVNIRAKGVRGAFSVSNDLQIENEQPRP